MVVLPPKVDEGVSTSAWPLSLQAATALTAPPQATTPVAATNCLRVIPLDTLTAPSVPARAAPFVLN